MNFSKPGTATVHKPIHTHTEILTAWTDRIFLRLPSPSKPMIPTEKRVDHVVCQVNDSEHVLMWVDMCPDVSCMCLYTAVFHDLRGSYRRSETQSLWHFPELCHSGSQSLKLSEKTRHKLQKGLKRQDVALLNIFPGLSRSKLSAVSLAATS